MQGNVDRYMCSDNAYIRSEYNGIRLNIALVLRTLFRIEAEVTPVAKRERLERMKLVLEEQDIVSNGTLDKLIREQRISSDMATSLMNDSRFAYDVQAGLISAAETVLAGMVHRSQELSDAELDRELTLKRDEILDRLGKEESRIDAITGRGNTAFTSLVIQSVIYPDFEVRA